MQATQQRRAQQQQQWHQQQCASSSGRSSAAASNQQSGAHDWRLSCNQVPVQIWRLETSRWRAPVEASNILRSNRMGRTSPKHTWHSRPNSSRGASNNLQLLEQWMLGAGPRRRGTTYRIYISKKANRKQRTLAQTLRFPGNFSTAPHPLVKGPAASQRAAAPISQKLWDSTRRISLPYESPTRPTAAWLAEAAATLAGANSFLCQRFC